MELLYDDFDTGLDMSKMTYLLIEGSRKFTEVYFFLSVINQLQKLGFIGEYVKMPSGSEMPFLELYNLDFRLDEVQVKGILDICSWDSVQKRKVESFYWAYINTDYFKRQLNGRNSKKVITTDKPT